jgi:hypothetical protein
MLYNQGEKEKTSAKSVIKQVVTAPLNKLLLTAQGLWGNLVKGGHVSTNLLVSFTSSVY